MTGSCCYTPASKLTTTTPTAVSAGGITLKDGTSTIGTMNPTGTTYTALNSTTTNTLKWMPGDTLNVSAAGDTVHLFSGSVTAVALFANIAPTMSDITPATVSRSANYTVTWTAGTGNITLILTATKGTASDGDIVCTGTDSGTMTVDSSLLGNFSANDTGTVSLERAIQSNPSDDNATITLTSSTSSSGQVRYQ
jgi:hypothetical protein